VSTAVRQLDPAERARVLALMGIDRYVRREARAEAPAVKAEVAAATPQGRARAADPLVKASVWAFVCDPAEIGADPVLSRYATLLAHLARAVGAQNLGAVRFADAPPAGCRAIAFGRSPGDAVDALLAPPLATLRNSAHAKRALWQDLRRALRPTTRA
jgi:hypothetical protein